ncbi:MAG: hypothetical protein P8Z30_20260 [Acidobacteriota bacterium]
MNQLPLPVPYASIRIQYSGAPGSMIAQVSSVDEHQDLVVDARTMNEGDGWAGSGANPWHLDKNTQSILFLTDEGDQPVRIGFSVTAGGVHYYLTSLKLAAHETRAIDLRKLRDAQVPDYKGHKIPAGAMDGSVNWVRMDDVPVEGRLMVIEKQQGVASSYDCTTCICPLNYSGLGVAPEPSFDDPVGDATQASATGTYDDCNANNYYYDETTASTWNSSNTSAFIMSITTKGLAEAIAAGSSTITATLSGVQYRPNCQPPPCHAPCLTNPYQGGANTAAYFLIQTSAPAGNHSVEVDASGQASNSLNFFVQVPTVAVIYSDTGTSERTCPLSGGSGCGSGRSIIWQFKDQRNPPQAINAALDIYDTMAIGSPNDFNATISQFSTTCPGNTGPCGVYTNSSGIAQNPDVNAFCSSNCISNGACVNPSLKTVVTQTWHANSIAVQQHNYTFMCGDVQIDGHD